MEQDHWVLHRRDGVERGQAAGANGPLQGNNLNYSGDFLIEYEEIVEPLFEGTIIDIESIGSFNNCYFDDDSRQYKDIIPVIFGYIFGKRLIILCAENEEEEITLLKSTIIRLIDRLPRPFYAFNTRFEKGVTFHACSLNINFEYELNAFPKEKKKYTVQDLGLNNYDDPFFDDGFLCLKAWENGDFENSVKHNRSCLLKERDILLMRGYREPDRLELKSIKSD